MERGIAVIGWTFDPSSVPTPSSTSPSWVPRWSATARTQDVTPPFILEAGHLRVPAGPGLGVAPIAEVLEGVTTAIERVTSRD
jgi:L-alanine-DL-glutamate epimerase-like enolase superfamily enzyme